MLINVGASAILTFPWIIAVAFCITDIAGILSGPVGTINFMGQLYYNITGGSQGATIGFTMFLPIMGICGVGSAIISATSRVVWSFARDGGLPPMFAQVSDRTKTPVPALLFTWGIVCALSLIYVGNSTAYYGLSSACAVTLVISYAIPIFANVVWGFSHCTVPKGPFTLGRYHRYVAVVALAWSGCVTIMMCFPSFQPVNEVNMNYASVVVGAGFIFATISWFTYGKAHYYVATNTLHDARSD